MKALAQRPINERSESGGRGPAGSAGGEGARPLSIEDVTLRPAAPDDCEQVWSWNFAPDVRARSKRALAVAFAEHERWFMRRLADGHDPMWIVEEHGRPVGVIRLDTSACGLTQVSIALAAHARGRGVGRRAITAACQAWGKPIVAEIFADNLPSRTCFEACGFHPVVESEDLLTYYWDPEP